MVFVIAGAIVSVIVGLTVIYGPNNHMAAYDDKWPWDPAYPALPEISVVLSVWLPLALFGGLLGLALLEFIYRWKRQVPVTLFVSP